MTRRAIAFLVLLLGLAALPAEGARADDAADDCPAALRIGVLALDRDGAGLTALQVRLAEDLGARASVRPRIVAEPVARAVAGFGERRLDVLLVAEEATRGVDPAATRVPLMRLQFASYRPARHQQGGDERATVATVRGFALPDGLVRPGERLSLVRDYDALLRMLGDGHVDRVIGFRPSLDYYLARHPELEAMVGTPLPVSPQRLSAHLSSALPLACRHRLARAARASAHEAVPRLFAEALPGVPFAPFAWHGDGADAASARRD